VASRAFPPWFSWFLESKLRLRMLQPQRLVGALPLAPDFTVVEIGSGTGVYARHVRQRVARFVGLELQWPLIQTAQERDASLVQVQGSALAVPLRAESVDLIYMVTVLGELTDPALALREMHAALKPGGFLAIAEQLPDPDYVSRTRVRMLCEEAGLSFMKVDGAWWSFVATFQRPRASR
jgi:ubiquinone/menaquinone biosynthesis C-methylase UbiE